MPSQYQFLKNLQNYTNKQIQPHNAYGLSYRTFELLLENHYDVFGLIEKGLAVDINTLSVGITANVSGIGEEALTESSIELQNLKIRTICQTKTKTAFLPIPC